MIYSRKIGNFKITQLAILNNRKLVLSIMSQVIIIRAEHILAYDVIEYTGISEHFDKVKFGAMIPFYTIEIKDKKWIFWRKENK